MLSLRSVGPGVVLSRVPVIAREGFSLILSLWVQFFDTMVSRFLTRTITRSGHDAVGIAHDLSTSRLRVIFFSHYADLMGPI